MSTVTICGLIALSRSTIEYFLLFKRASPTPPAEVLTLIHYILQHQRKLGKAGNVRTSLYEEISQEQFNMLRTHIVHLIVDNTEQPGSHAFAKKYTELFNMLPSNLSPW